MLLNKRQIMERLNDTPPMVSNIKDINIQLQPLALDLTVKSIYKWKSAGTLDFDNSRRILSKKEEVNTIYINRNNAYYLAEGSYQVLVNEFFNMPLDIAGFTTSRSSLQRCGCSIKRGFFDPGFVGEGVVLLQVSNEYGLCLFKDARICQMEFQLLEKTDGYNGIYSKR